ncbi:MAG: 5'-deoxyadenosine deaminase [Deltaproteobacteria bacterium]|nr:5'-deoxyadenosine deaminase [Deltaproteobacteria bacterium]
MNIFIEGGTIITMDAKRRVFEGDIYIEGGKIHSLGPSGLVKPPAGTRTLRAYGCYILPGFVQSHIHLCQVLFRGHAEDRALMPWLMERIWPFEGAHKKKSLQASAQLGIAELLLGGTTAALDMGTVQHTQVLFQTAARMGFRLTTGKAMMDKGSPRPGNLKETTEESLKASKRLCKKWHEAENGRLRYAYAPRFILSCTQKLLQQVSIDAREMGVLIHTHAAENPGELEVVKKQWGKSNIEALHELGISGDDVLLAHCVHLSAKERKLLAKTNTAVAHCPSTNLKLASGIADVPGLREAGIRVGIGADGAPCNNRMSMFTEMRSASLLQKPRHGAGALPAREVLEMATRGGAEIIGLDNVGHLGVGMRGDVIVVDASKPHMRPAPEDPYSALVYSAEARDVRDVFVDGAWLVRNSELVRADVGLICNDAEAELKKLKKRV